MGIRKTTDFLMKPHWKSDRCLQNKQKQRLNTRKAKCPDTKNQSSARIGPIVASKDFLNT